MALLSNILPDHVANHFLNPKVDQSVSNNNNNNNNNILLILGTLLQ